MAGLTGRIQALKQGGGSTSEQRAQQQAMKAAGFDSEQSSRERMLSESLANKLLTGDDSQLLSFAADMASWSDDQQMEARYRDALAIAESQSPGISQRLTDVIGSSEQDAIDSGDMPGPSAKKPKVTDYYPKKEMASSYGAGSDAKRKGDKSEGSSPKSQNLFQMLDKSLEQRSKSSRKKSQKLEIYSANEKVYREIAAEQLRLISETPLSPEHVAMLSPKQVSQLTGVPVKEVTESTYHTLIGVKLPPQDAAILIRTQRDAVSGKPFGWDVLSADRMQEIGGNLAKYSDSREASSMEADNSMMREQDTSTRDQVLAKIRSAAASGTTINPDQVPGLRLWRFDWPASQNQEIVRPGLAPSGDFFASLLRPLYDRTRTNGEFMETVAPVLDRSFREYARIPPLAENYRGNKTLRTAADYANLRMEPDRGGYYLKAAERNNEWTYPQFIEGVQMNRGRGLEPLNLGGLLLDEVQSAPQPDATISTQEQPQTKVMPADGDVGMYGRRPMDERILAALLA